MKVDVLIHRIKYFVTPHFASKTNRNTTGNKSSRKRTIHIMTSTARGIFACSDLFPPFQICSKLLCSPKKYILTSHVDFPSKYR